MAATRDKKSENRYSSEESIVSRSKVAGGKGKLTFGKTAATFASQISNSEIEKVRGEAALGKLGRIVKQLDAKI